MMLSQIVFTLSTENLLNASAKALRLLWSGTGGMVLFEKSLSAILQMSLVF